MSTSSSYASNHQRYRSSLQYLSRSSSLSSSSSLSGYSSQSNSYLSSASDPEGNRKSILADSDDDASSSEADADVSLTGSPGPINSPVRISSVRVTAEPTRFLA